MSSPEDRDDNISDRPNPKPPRERDDKYTDSPRPTPGGGDYDDIPDLRKRDVNIPNYLTQSILVTLFCCVIGGIVAIINAAKVNGLAEAGDYAAAQKASDEAKKWCWISLIGGLVWGAVVIFGQVMAEQRFK